MRTQCCTRVFAQIYIFYPKNCAFTGSAKKPVRDRVQRFNQKRKARGELCAVAIAGQVQTCREIQYLLVCSSGQQEYGRCSEVVCSRICVCVCVCVCMRFLCQVSSLCLDRPGQSGSLLSMLRPNTHIYQNTAQQQTGCSQGREVLGIGPKGRLEKDRWCPYGKNRKRGGTESWKDRDCRKGGRWDGSRLTLSSRSAEKGQRVRSL